MLHYDVLVGGHPQTTTAAPWVHTPHADDVLAQPFRVAGAKAAADVSGHRAASGYVGAVARSTPGQNILALHAADGARLAPGGWGTAEDLNRLQLVTRVHNALRDRRDELAEILVAEGVPWRAARWQVLAMLAQIDARAVGEALTDMFAWDTDTGHVISTRRVPLGVVGLQPSASTPALDAIVGVWALATGNTLIVNCPPAQPLSTAWLYHEVVRGELRATPTARGNELSVLCDDPGLTCQEWAMSGLCDAVWHFGPGSGDLEQRGTAAGKRIIVDRPGSSGMLVWNDADVVAAAQALAEGFHASGDTGIAPTYAIAHPSIAEALVEAVGGLARELRPGPPSDHATVLAALDYPAGFGALVDRASQAGAKLAAGGRVVDRHGAEHPNGPFVEPTVLWGHASDDQAGDLLRLGWEPNPYPVVVVVIAPRNDRDMLHLWATAAMNANPHAVVNSVWTNDSAKAQAFADRVRSGGRVNINTPHLRPFAGTPLRGAPGAVGGAWGETTLPWRRTTRMQNLVDGTAVVGAALPSGW